MYRYIHSIESAGNVFDSAAKLVESLFRGLDKLFMQVGSWDPGDKYVFRVITGYKDKNGDPYEFRLLQKCAGRGDGYVIMDYYLKLKDGDNSDMVKKTGVKLNAKGVNNPDETDDEHLQYLKEQQNKVIIELLKKYTKDKIDTYDEVLPIDK